MGFLVQKFGGTSVGTPERIQSVAQRIARASAQGHRLAVVVSAMGHTTDELLSLARQVSVQPHPREEDMLLTAGERISMALLSMALRDQGVSAMSFTGSQTGIITDASHRRARIKRILGDRVRAALDGGQVAIVAGFQGVSETKDITTLGRGGSDTTAVALAVALGAEVCEIYTDVDGVYSADPRKVPGARKWDHLPYDLMLELAYRGAGVLHPRSVELAKKFKLPVHVRSSLNEDLGTLIGPAGPERGKSMEEFKFVGVAADADKMPVAVQLARPSVLGAVLDYAAGAGLTVMCPIFHEGRVWFFIDRGAQAEWKRHLDRLVGQEFVGKFDFHDELVPLSVVGECLSQDGTVFSRIFETLSHINIPISFGVSSAAAFTGAVPLARLDEAVQSLHHQFMNGTAQEAK